MVPAMASLPTVQMMARVLCTMVELIVVEVIGETVGEAGEHGKVAISMLALIEVAYLLGVLPMVIGDSNNS